MIADVDKDGSGAIDYDEFYHMMTAKIGERDTKEELTKAFKIIDLDNNVSIMLSFFLSFISQRITISSTKVILLHICCRGRYLLMISNAWQRTWVKTSLMLRYVKWWKKLTVTVSC